MAYSTTTAKELGIPLSEYGRWMVDLLNAPKNNKDYLDPKNLSSKNELIKRLDYVKNELSKLKEKIK